MAIAAYFLRSRSHDPAMHRRRRLNCRSVGLEIDRCQKRVHQCSESPSTRPLEIAAFDPLERQREAPHPNRILRSRPSRPRERTSDVTVWTSSDGSEAFASSALRSVFHAA